MTAQDACVTRPRVLARILIRLPSATDRKFVAQVSGPIGRNGPFWWNERPEPQWWDRSWCCFDRAFARIPANVPCTANASGRRVSL